jgi:molybdopterin converting factor small subunit
MSTLSIPTPLRVYADGQIEIKTNASTVGDALTELVTRYPTIKQHIFKEDGELRPFVNLFKGKENIVFLQGLETPVGENDVLRIIPSIAGGC